MFSKLFEITTATISSTYDAVASVTEYVAEDIASIPDAIAKGWEEGIMPAEETPTEETANDGLGGGDLEEVI